MTFNNERNGPAGGGGTDPMDPAFAPLDAPVIAALRELYAAPAGESYWDGLEERVMTRVLGRSSAEWWQVINGWSRVAAMAAAVALIVATALLVTVERRASEFDLAAYDSVADEVLAFSFDARPSADEARVNERATSDVLPH